MPATHGLAQGLDLPGGAVEIGSPISIVVTPPPESSGKTIYVRFYRDGKYVEDFHWYLDLGEKPAPSELRIHAPSRPGAYDVRMFDVRPFDAPLASRKLAVLATRDDDALSLPGATAYEIGEKIVVSADPGQDRYLTQYAHVTLYKDGKPLRDGLLEWFGEPGDRAPRAFAFNAPDRPGLYEFRFYDRHVWKDPHLISVQPFRVVATRDDDALDIPDKEAFEIGERIVVRADPGPGRYFTEYGHVTLYKDGKPLRDGIRQWFGEVGDRSPKEFTFHAPDRPGLYEFRFYDRHLWKEPHLIALRPFAVVATRDDGALEIPDKPGFAPREQIAVRAGPGPDRYFTEYGHVTLYKDGKPLRDGIRQWFGEVGDRSPKTFLFEAPEEPGRYEFRFYDRHLWKEPHLIALKPFSVVSDGDTPELAGGRGPVPNGAPCPPALPGAPGLPDPGCEGPAGDAPGGDVATASSTDPLTGETTTTTRNPDGSRTIVRTDREGRVVAIETQGPPGSGAGTLSFVDPETGVTRTIIRDGDGRRRVLESVGWIDPLGDANLLHVDNFGREIEVLAMANGISVIEARDLMGRAEETIVLEDGTRMTSRQTPLGDRIETVETPDGLAEIAVFDSAGQLVTRTRSNEDGSATTVDAKGYKRTVSAPVGDGTVEIVEEDPHGNLTRTAYDAQGTVVATRRERARPYEPGEAYYLNDLKGNIPWDELDDGDRKRFADTEQMMRNNRDTAEFRTAQAEARRVEKERQNQRFAELDAELDAELADIAAGQAAADRAALARDAQLELDARRDEVTDRLSDLDRRIEVARDAGNIEEQRKLEAEHDELHDASLDLFLPTEAEEAEIGRRQAVRDALLDEVGGVARTLGDKAYRHMSEDQDDTEFYAAGARYVSLGAEMQHMLAGNQRVAMREKAGAQGWFEAIGQKLADPGTTAEEREILADMRDLARLRQEGGDRLMSDNARIVAAGYATDAVLMAAGPAAKATLQGGRQLASRAIVQRATSAAFAEQIAAGATRGSALRAARTAGQAALAAAENRAGALQTQFASTRAGAAADRLGRLLTTELHVSRRLAEHKVLEAAVVDAAVGASADVGMQLYQTGTVDPVETVRGAVAGSMMAGLHATGKGAVRAARSRRPASVSADAAATPARADDPAGGGATTIDDPHAGSPDIFDDSDDVLPGPAEPPPGARSRHLSEAEIRRLHEPGRNLSAEDIQAKADLYRDLAQRRRAVEQAVKEGQPRGQVRERVRDLVAQHDRIRAGSNRQPGGMVRRPSTHGPGAQERPAVALRMPEDPDGTWSRGTTRIDGNRRPPGNDTARIETEVIPSRRNARETPPPTPRPRTDIANVNRADSNPGVRPGPPDPDRRPMPGGGEPPATGTSPAQPSPDDTLVLAEPPTHGGPGDATLLLGADGRPVVRDGALATTETPPARPSPNDTLVLAEPPTHGEPGDATLLLGADGRPVVRDGALATTETPPATRAENDAAPAAGEFDPTGLDEAVSAGSGPTAEHFPSRATFDMPGSEMDRILIEHHGGLENVPPVHRHRFETLEHISRDGAFSPTGEGPHFSDDGELPRRGGNMLIRVKPEARDTLVHFERNPNEVRGLEPYYYPGGIAGGGQKRPVPARLLEYFHPGGDGIETGWYPVPDFKPLEDRFPPGTAISPADLAALTTERERIRSNLRDTTERFRQSEGALKQILQDEMSAQLERLQKLTEVLARQ
ncbi:MAG: hypothetical protein LPL00_02740 [Alphaproteobacteria bacterium]|nr:hypothetical protein [Alphaproteobacteria bacterium]MDX5368357.1 hypothetical protein [Alphaproteobacteria bacterium]MDX5463152.1 hypothetical protein [Alphaproteobacteria bacterium]